MPVIMTSLRRSKAEFLKRLLLVGLNALKAYAFSSLDNQMRQTIPGGEDATFRRVDFICYP
jgi:hypothetical protein